MQTAQPIPHLPDSNKRHRTDEPTSPYIFWNIEGHSAQECFSLIAFIREKTTEISAWLDKRRKGKKKKKKGGGNASYKGGPNGRGGGGGPGGNSKGGRGNRGNKGGKGCGNGGNKSCTADNRFDPSFSEWFANHTSSEGHPTAGSP